MMKLMKVKSKKAQFEVIGLLIIVILISLGILFVVKFIITKEPSDVGKAQVESQFAAGFLNSFLETTTEDCSRQQIKALIHDCISNYPAFRVKCNNLGDPIDSCDYINQTAFRVLSKTLIQNNRAFIFYITDGTNTYVNINRSLERCAKSTRIETKSIPLQVNQDVVELFLRICN